MVFVLALALATLSYADDPSASALSAARNWLVQIDAGQYEQSYDEGCTAFHNKTPENEWLTVLQAIRTPLGTPVNRQEVGHSYKPDGFEGLDGECMVITYNTTFSKGALETEVVVLKREAGTWRGAGYNAQTQPNPQTQDDSVPQVETQVEQQSSRPKPSGQ